MQCVLYSVEHSLGVLALKVKSLFGLCQLSKRFSEEYSVYLFKKKRENCFVVVIKNVENIHI